MNMNAVRRRIEVVYRLKAFSSHIVRQSGMVVVPQEIVALSKMKCTIHALKTFQKLIVERWTLHKLGDSEVFELQIRVWLCF